MSKLFYVEFILVYLCPSIKTVPNKINRKIYVYVFSGKKQLVLLIIQKIDQTFFFFFNITRWKNMYNISESTF